jgi:hypothetical protein
LLMCLDIGVGVPYYSGGKLWLEVE